MLNKISVLMTVYNGERYLKKSIKSILDQTHINFEFIIVDDYSDDASVAVVENFNDKRINLFKLENKFGRTKALNFGLKNVIQILLRYKMLTIFLIKKDFPIH